MSESTVNLLAGNHKNFYVSSRRILLFLLYTIGAQPFGFEGQMNGAGLVHRLDMVCGSDLTHRARLVHGPNPRCWITLTARAPCTESGPHSSLDHDHCPVPALDPPRAHDPSPAHKVMSSGLQGLEIWQWRRQIVNYHHSPTTKFPDPWEALQAGYHGSVGQIWPTRWSLNTLFVY